jgi:DNA-binding response OmpR family regulator
MLILDWQVVDLGAPKCCAARAKTADTAPVLFLTTSSGEDDIVAGLTAGADDYMIKPLRRGELARVQALLRAPIRPRTAPNSCNSASIFETRPGRLLMKASAGRDAQGIRPGAVIFPQHWPAPVARLHP